MVRFDEVEHMFMDVAELVFGIVWSAFDLVPDDAVAQYPPLPIGHGESDSPRQTKERFLLVSVSDVEPKRSSRLEHALQFLEEHQQIIDVLLPCCFKPNAAACIGSLSPVWRRGQCAVDA